MDGLYLISASVMGVDEDSIGCMEIVVLSIKSEDAAMASNGIQEANKPKGSFILSHGVDILDY